MKKLLSILVVPILAVMLYWFFYSFNESFKKDNKVSLDTPNIIVKNEETSELLNIEDYIIGVVSCEMPALYHEEALKAQAIAARTYAADMLSSNKKVVLTDTSDQCYISEEERKDKWGNNFEKYNEKLKSIVLSTKEMIMKKNNQLFKSFYFSTSNGYTEDSISVFNQGNLISVESPWDKDSKNYLVTTDYKKSELEKVLGKFGSIKIISRDQHNHVTKVKVDDKEYTGVSFRKKLKLRSTDFDIKVNNDIYAITTRGYGHGVGMSQNGANYLANNGYSYKEILEYYYKDITIEKY